MNITTNPLTDRYNDLMEDVRREIINQLPDGRKFDFEDNGFEDEAGNDVEAVDTEVVHISGGETYSLHELSFWDGIKIIDTMVTMQRSAQF